MSVRTAPNAPKCARTPISARLTARRDEVDKSLHIRKSLSYRLFRPHFGHTVLLRDVWSAMSAAARNGATFNPQMDLENLLDVSACEELTGMCRWTLFRLIEKAPHFRLSRKMVLIKRSDFTDAVERRSARRRKSRRLPALAAS